MKQDKETIIIVTEQIHLNLSWKLCLEISYYFRVPSVFTYFHLSIYYAMITLLCYIHVDKTQVMRSLWFIEKSKTHSYRNKETIARQMLCKEIQRIFSSNFMCLCGSKLLIIWRIANLDIANWAFKNVLFTIFTPVETKSLNRLMFLSWDGKQFVAVDNKKLNTNSISRPMPQNNFIIIKAII